MLIFELMQADPGWYTSVVFGYMKTERKDLLVFNDFYIQEITCHFALEEEQHINM